MANVYETISSLKGSLYCGFSKAQADDTYIERHQEITAAGIADNLAVFENDEPLRAYWGGAKIPVRAKLEEIVAARIADAKATFEAEADPTPWDADLRGRDRDEWRHEAAEWQRLK